MSWIQIYRLEVLYPDRDAFVGLWNSVTNTHAAEWASCLAASCPAETIPAAWAERLTDFQRLVVLRVLQPAKVRFLGDAKSSLG
jgi:hypothetical protein